jgi:hypothetical protein
MVKSTELILPPGDRNTVGVHPLLPSVLANNSGLVRFDDRLSLPSDLYEQLNAVRVFPMKVSMINTNTAALSFWTQGTIGVSGISVGMALSHTYGGAGLETSFERPIDDVGGSEKLRVDYNAGDPLDGPLPPLDFRGFSIAGGKLTKNSDGRLIGGLKSPSLLESGYPEAKVMLVDAARIVSGIMLPKMVFELPGELAADSLKYEDVKGRPIVDVFDLCKSELIILFPKFERR